jgi:heme/copper-type cytochrome/quinol oxidase subunit 2
VPRRGLAALGLALALLVGAAPAGPDVAVKVSKQGFQPSRITVRRGETTRLVLSAAEGEHCFAIDAFRVEKRVVPGRPTRLELTPGQAGVFPFYCCLESGEAARVERGELTVTE